MPDRVINTYNSFVLEGAWAEERTGLPPAPGGVPDLGFRLYETKYTSDFKPPDPTAELTFPRYKPRYGMLTKDTWNEASYSYGGGPGALQATLLKGKKAFNLTHSGRDMTAAEIAATFTSTAREASISGVQVSATASTVAAKNAATVAKTNLAQAAGGAGSVNVDRGKHTQGVSGEVIKDSADLRYDSNAQRAWLGRPDAGLANSRKVSARAASLRKLPCAIPFSSLTNAPTLPSTHTTPHHTQNTRSRRRRGRRLTG